VQGPKKRWPASNDERLRGQRASDGGAPGEAESGGERVILSRKELARELRREAYQRAKRARAADPRQQALKEKAKERRRELYQQVKARRKSRAAELEAVQRGTQATAQAKARGEGEARLAARLSQRAPVTDDAAGAESASIEGRARFHAGRVARLETAPTSPADLDDAAVDDAAVDDQHLGLAPHDRAGAASTRALALDIERALQNGEVRALMARLERESATLAAQHRTIQHEDDENVP
jgi:hypothetical protein